MTDDRPYHPNWWKVGRRASFVVCAGDMGTFDEWMEGPHGQSLARHLARHSRWRLVREQDAGGRTPDAGAAAEKRPRKSR
jgi:hypothetical protein